MVLNSYIGYSQNVVCLTMDEVIRLAVDSSLTAFKNKNIYKSDYWEYRMFKAERLPSLSYNLSPVNYYRYLTTRYNFEKNRDEYREQKSYNASTGFSLSQNFVPLGGKFYIETSLDYLRSFGNDTYNQFTSIPVRLGYTNDVIGYNKYKWDKRIEPLKYEKAKMEYLYNTEEISYQAISLFFALALAQNQYNLAKEQLLVSDSLYAVGCRKYQIASMSKSDLLRLELNIVNAQSSIVSAKINMQKAIHNLVNFLGISGNEINITLPNIPGELLIDESKAIELMHQNSYVILDKQKSVIEAEKRYDEVNKTTRFSARLSASIGFNQESEKFKSVYKDPMRQDLVSLNIEIPLLDWGVGKGKRQVAASEVNVAKIEHQQKEVELEQNLVVIINELYFHKELLKNSEEAMKIAEEVFEETKKGFVSSSSITVYDLNEAQEQLLTAKNRYITCMSAYWLCFYELRKLTLFDFVNNVSLSEKFDFDNLR